MHGMTSRDKGCTVSDWPYTDVDPDAEKERAVEQIPLPELNTAWPLLLRLKHPDAFSFG